jgi:hypothetical protein
MEQNANGYPLHFDSFKQSVIDSTGVAIMRSLEVSTTCATEKSEFCMLVIGKLCNIVTFFGNTDVENYKWLIARLTPGSLS